MVRLRQQHQQNQQQHQQQHVISALYSSSSSFPSTIAEPLSLTLDTNDSALFRCVPLSSSSSSSPASAADAAASKPISFPSSRTTKTSTRWRDSGVSALGLTSFPGPRRYDTRIITGSCCSSQPPPGHRHRLGHGILLLLLVMAWGWIMTTFGMILYYGFYNRRGHIHLPQHNAHEHIHHEHEHPHKHLDVGPGIGVMIPPLDSSSSSSSRRRRSSSRVSIPGQLQPYESPLLIFTCRRADYLNATLYDILKYIPSDCSMGCPIYISQDGTDAHVTRVIQQFTKRLSSLHLHPPHNRSRQSMMMMMIPPIIHLQHKSALRGGVNAYQALARHYGWALHQVFKEEDKNEEEMKNPIAAQRVLILEEDLHISVDFFDYFTALAPLLDTDPSLLAISAFNDNGFDGHVLDPTRVLRSDFFPGLGWMMTRKLWMHELQINWPNGYWDDWLREPSQRKDRHILRPEISRTFHFGAKDGASNNIFGPKLAQIRLNPTRVDWSHQDLSYLRLDLYDQQYWNRLADAVHANSLSQALEEIKISSPNRSAAAAAAAATAVGVQLAYQSLDEFRALATALDIMTDEKSGIPRTSYKGVVEYRPLPNKDPILYLTPPLHTLKQEFSHVHGQSGTAR